MAICRTFCLILTLATLVIIQTHGVPVKKGGARQFLNFDSIPDLAYESKKSIDLSKRPGGHSFFNFRPKRPGGRSFLGGLGDLVYPKRSDPSFIIPSEGSGVEERRKRPGARAFFGPSFYDLYYPHDTRSVGLDEWHRKKRPGGRSFFHNNGPYNNVWAKKDYDWNYWYY